MYLASRGRETKGKKDDIFAGVGKTTAIRPAMEIR